MTVTVVLRAPNALHLDLLDTSGEQATIQKRVTVRGHHQMAIIGATHGETTVTKSFWDAWLKANEKSPLVLNRVIFAKEKPADAKAAAAELKKEKTGMEELDPADLPKQLEERDPTKYGE